MTPALLRWGRTHASNGSRRSRSASRLMSVLRVSRLRACMQGPAVKKRTLTAPAHDALLRVSVCADCTVVVGHRHVHRSQLPAADSGGQTRPKGIGITLSPPIFLSGPPRGLSPFCKPSHHTPPQVKPGKAKNDIKAFYRLKDQVPP